MNDGSIGLCNRLSPVNIVLREVIPCTPTINPLPPANYFKYQFYPSVV